MNAQPSAEMKAYSAVIGALVSHLESKGLLVAQEFFDALSMEHLRAQLDDPETLPSLVQITNLMKATFPYPIE